MDIPVSPSIYPAWIAGIAAFIIYFLTCAPTITWEHGTADSGEFASVAATLGIAHPSGYPLYTILGWILINIFQKWDPAQVLVLFSVVCGAVSTGIIARASALTISLISGNGKISALMTGLLGAIAAMFAALNPLMWSQSTICEVYALAVLFQSIVWLILVRYLIADPADNHGSGYGILIGLGAVFGLLLAHHVGGGAILLPIVIVLAMSSKRPSIKDYLKGILAVIPGLLFYLYLPIRSSRNPSIDWGNPETLPNFISHVSARIYRPVIFAADNNELADRLRSFMDPDPIFILGIVLFIAGLVLLIKNFRDRRAGILIFGIIPFALWSWAFATWYVVYDYDIFYYPLIPPAAIMIGLGLTLCFKMIGKRFRFFPQLFIIAIVFLLVFSAKNNWDEMDLTKPDLDSAPVFVYVTLNKLPENTLVIAGSDYTFFPLLYGKHVGITIPWTGENLPARTDIDILPAQLTGEDWFRENIEGRMNQDVPIILPDPAERDKSSILRQFIDLNIVNRPVYIDDQASRMLEDYKDNYILTKIGGLFQVVLDISADD